ncbi:MAG: DUF503 domain-containing protein [Hydrogenobaculum sp.]
MIVGIVIIDFYIPDALSLKEKRHYVRSIKDKLVSNFKISVSEVDFHDSWQRSRIGAAVVGVDKEGVNQALSSIVKFSEKQWPDIIFNISLEFLNI